MKKGTLFLGTSNVTLPGPKKAFPTEFQTLSRLAYYSILFNSVELNSTFYKVPRFQTFERWSTETRTPFAFTIKLTREVTHQKQLRYDVVNIDNFLRAANAIGEKKGCLLVQFPASITEDYFEVVLGILKRIRRLNTKPKWRVVVEFRHDSWYTEHVYSMLAAQNAVLVLHDKRGSRTPLDAALGPAVYLRFHGPHGNYRGTYTTEVLAAFAERIRGWTEQGKAVYVYFNNTMGSAFEDAMALRALCV